MQEPGHQLDRLQQWQSPRKERTAWLSRGFLSLGLCPKRLESRKSLTEHSNDAHRSASVFPEKSRGWHGSAAGTSRASNCLQPAWENAHSKVQCLLNTHPFSTLKKKIAILLSQIGDLIETSGSTPICCHGAEKIGSGG